MTPPIDPLAPGAVRAPLPRLMLVTDRHRTLGRDLVRVVGEALAGGVRLVQLREKDLAEKEAAALLERLLAAAPPGSVLLVNGRPELARRYGVGLHLPAGVPRPSQLPALWGRAVHGEDEARAALREGPAYILLGNVFPTPSKPGRAGAGMDAVRRVARSCAARGDGPVALYAIGGIGAENAAEVTAAGAYGVAVCGAILEATEPGAAAAAIIASLP